MKNKKVFVFSFTILLILSSVYHRAVGSMQVAEQESKMDGIRMLKEFYTAYLTEELKEKTANNRDAILKKYCTERLLEEISKKLEAGEINHDSFIKAQDTNPDMLRTLYL